MTPIQLLNMKKLLLLSFIIATISTEAQDFWTEHATSQPASSTGVRSISIIDANHAWLSMGCGTGNCDPIRRYAKTANGGSSWTTGEIDLGPNWHNLLIGNISAVSASVAYASVYPDLSFSPFVPGGIWKTIDGGMTWMKQPEAVYDQASSYPNMVYFWNANDGVTMGDPANGYFEIYTTSDGGTSWTRVAASPVLLPNSTDEVGVVNNFTVTGNTIWIGTTAGRILKSADKGITWTMLSTNIPELESSPNGFETAQMAFTDENNGIIITRDWQIYNTNDGGVNWTQIIGLDEDKLRNFDVAAVPGLSNTYVAVGESSDIFERGSSYTVDGGMTWIDINDHPDVNYVDGGHVAMFDADHGLAGGFSQTPTIGGIFVWGGGSMLRTAHLLKVATFTGETYVMAAPNPTSGSLTVSGKNISKVVVLDVLGKQITTTDYSQLNNVTVNLDNLSKGVYLLKISSDKGASTIRVVKQ